MDFFTFKSFISIEVLIIFYYLGAIIMPIIIWFALRRFSKKYHLSPNNIMNTKQKVILTLLFLIAFFFMQLFWRMLFEFLIAYMQIRDALLAQY
ncbi:MAG: Unknown protein [uncultured Sulfurovum sp.]|uniref:DUF4282 domain-containing protein n=1 Tax=uncultured Sulfurovum sp. TaxID=269237 RepID=A0A6S6U160_9BACT|nr:MAG: Unknown protein [uncultured Sulfurovum sp.]